MVDSSLSPRGSVTAVLGPTNTGKTHLAVERMLGHQSGMIGLPLRLLAREIYDRIVSMRGVHCVALITGEEKIVPSHPQYYVCTVEAMPLDIDVAFLAIDEIQLCEDPERGYVFTQRLLSARGSHETMFLGAETMRNPIRQLIPDAAFVTRPRFSDLSYTGSKKLTRLPRRTAIVAFSAENVYAIAELIRRQRGGAAVVMGALSPRTRNAQVELYQSGDVDFMVATDAIGMGLNMDVDHVAFASTTKFDGRSMRALRATEMAQIAGRAGRYMNDGTFGTTAQAGDIDEDLIEQIENHRFDPIRTLQWRNTDLQFASIPALIQSLETPPQLRGLLRSRPAIDLQSLKALASHESVARIATSPAAIRILWDVCQIPDFRKVMSEEHTRLLVQIYQDVMSDRGGIDPDWMAGHVAKLDRTDGDLDTLATRIAHTRTWTFIANRGGWIKDQAHWQAKTRAIEDKLSDALHERLTQRFIDRRTSILMKRMRDREDLLAGVNTDGEVSVEGEYVGRLQGFHFEPDPRAQGIHGKALRAAAMTALEPEIASRAKELATADNDAITLHETGRLWWKEAAIAKLSKGPTWLAPKIELIQAETLDADARAAVAERLATWLAAHMNDKIEPLMQLHKTVEDKDQQDLTGLARGLGFQIVENYGLLDRAKVADVVKSLEQPDRAQLRRLGVRFGEFSIYMPKLLKPAASQLLLLLWKVDQGEDATYPAPPTPGLVSVPRERDVADAFYAANGFRPCGKRVVRVDMLERLAQLIREILKPVAATTPVRVTKPSLIIDSNDQRITLPKADAPTPPTEEAPAEETKPAPQPKFGEFVINPDLMSLVGCSGDDFESILRAVGFRKRTEKTGDTDEDGNEIEIGFWKRLPPPGSKRRGPPRHKGKDGQAKGKSSGKPKGKPKGPRGKKPSTKPRVYSSKPKDKAADPDNPFAALQALNKK